MLCKYNIDDLDTSKTAAVKVVIFYPSGEVSVKIKLMKRAKVSSETLH